MSNNTVTLGEYEEAPIELTERAIIAIKEVMAIDELLSGSSGLRVAVVGGGCSGFQYSLDFTNSQDYDLVFNIEDINVYIDPISAMHLEGTTIDYVMGISGNGFKFQNPSAKSTCGCGSSFSS